MEAVLAYVAKKERIDLPSEVASRIAAEAVGNLRRALLVLEALKMQYPDLNAGNLEIAKPDWESYCTKVADLIVAEQSAQRILDVRAKLYELISHCIPPSLIIKTLADRVVEQVDEALKADIMHWAAFYEHRMRQGSKKIFHLEAWVVKVMSLYKHFMYDIDLTGFDD